MLRILHILPGLLIYYSNLVKTPKNGVYNEKPTLFYSSNAIKAGVKLLTLLLYIYYLFIIRALIPNLSNITEIRRVFAVIQLPEIISLPPAASVLLSAIICPGSDTLTENLTRGYQMNKFS